MENKCKNCNCKISKDDIFCPHCGISLQNQGNKYQLNPENNFIDNDILIKKNNKPLIIAIAIILSIVIVICLIVSISYNAEKNRQYTITLYSNNSIYSIIHTNKTDVILPLPTLSNCFFDGWFTDNGESATYAIKNNTTKDDMYIYAKWYSYVDEEYTYSSSNEDYIDKLDLGVVYISHNTNLNTWTITVGISLHSPISANARKQLVSGSFPYLYISYMSYDFYFRGQKYNNQHSNLTFYNVSATEWINLQITNIKVILSSLTELE